MSPVTGEDSREVVPADCRRFASGLMAARNFAFLLSAGLLAVPVLLALLRDRNKGGTQRKNLAVAASRNFAALTVYARANLSYESRFPDLFLPLRLPSFSTTAWRKQCAR